MIVDPAYILTNLLIVTVLINCSIIVNTTSSKRISATYPGRFHIGVLVSVHTPPKSKKSRILECGEIREHYGIQRIEATLKTIEEINRDPTILPNITLGVDVRDSCWYAPIALHQTIELIRESISPLPASVKNRPNETLIGIIGPASSSIALQVQNLLQLFSIPQIGYSTTSKDLSDKSRYSSFMRVVPSDYYQAQVMIDIVKKFNYSYVSAVNTNENYGQSGIQAFRELAEENNICIAKEDSILSNANEEQFEEVLKNLNEDINANVVICFCEGLTVRGLLMAMNRLNMTERFLIIGSDGWADRQDVVTDYEKEAKGAITIRIHSPYVKSFDDYYFGLNPFENKRNPWFKEFWQKKFHCRIPEAFPLNISIGANDTKLCTGKEKLSEKYKQEPKLSFLIKAIYTMAHGLHHMHQDVCGTDSEVVCEQMYPFNGTKFFSYLMNVSFSYENDLVEFDSGGDLMRSRVVYDIMNFQDLGEDSGYDYVQVGYWNNGQLKFFHNPPKIQNPGEKIVESVCSRPCPLGSRKIIQSVGAQEKKCCWMCVACERNQFLFNETTCKLCPLGSWPSSDKTDCLKIPLEELKLNEFIIATCISVVGIFLTIIVLIVFLKYNNTPVVKASTRELSYMILLGMILSHLSIFAVLHPPTVISCTITRIVPGVSFAMIYGSLLVKTNRIARLLAISKKRFPSTKLKFMSSISQVFLALGIILIEMGLSLYALYRERPGVMPYFPSERRSMIICNTSIFGVIAPKGFIFFLILLCTLYALKTRNVPENFNETKFVGFAMYTNIVIWIAFFPIYYGSELKILTKCLCISLSSIMTLAFLFFPKIYIVIFHPEKNIRALFTTSKTIRCHIGATRYNSNISNKHSSSISSARAVSANYSEITKESNARSLKPTLTQTACQTSFEKLNLVERSSSPIDCSVTSKLIENNFRNLYQMSPKRLKTSPNRTKLKRNKVYYERKDFPLNHSDLPKYQRVRKLESKPKTPVKLCSECLEIEKFRNNFENQAISMITKSNNIPIFTIDKLGSLPPVDKQIENTRKVAICEESLSECSISDSLDCKLKKITIKLN